MPLMMENPWWGAPWFLRPDSAVSQTSPSCPARCRQRLPCQSRSPPDEVLARAPPLIFFIFKIFWNAMNIIYQTMLCLLQNWIWNVEDDNCSDTKVKLETHLTFFGRGPLPCDAGALTQTKDFRQRSLASSLKNKTISDGDIAPWSIRNNWSI